MGGGDKRSRSKRKPARYQHDDDGDDVPAAATAVSSDKKKSVDEEAPLPPQPQRQKDDGEGERRGKRSRSKPSRFQEDKQDDDARTDEETTTANAKKKPPLKKISKPAAAAKKVSVAATGRSTPKPVAAQNPKPTDTDPKKGSTRIKIKLSVGKNKGKKRKADPDDVDDEHITEVKVRVRAAKKLIAGHGVAKIAPTTLGKIATPRTAAKLHGETDESSVTETDSAVARNSGGGKNLKVRAGANKASTISSDDNVDDKSKSKVPDNKEMKVKVCVEQKPIHKKPATASFEQENGEGIGDDSRSKSFTSSNGNEVRPGRLCIFQGCDRYKKARCEGYCLKCYKMFVGDAPPANPDAKQDNSDDEGSAKHAKPSTKLAYVPAVKVKDVPSKRKKGEQDLTSTVTVTIRVAGNLLKDVCHASGIDRARAPQAPESKPDEILAHKETAKVGTKGPPKDTTKTDANHAPPSNPDAKQDKPDDEDSFEHAKPSTELAREPVDKDIVPSKRKKGEQDLTSTVTVTIRVAGNLLKDVCHASGIDRARAPQAPESKPNEILAHRETAKVGAKGPPKDTTKTDATQDSDVSNLQRFDCPFPGCNKKCLTKKGLAAHYGMMHIGAPKLDWKSITSYEIDPPKAKIPPPSSNQLDTDTCRSAPKRKPVPEDSHLIRYKCPFPGCEKKGLTKNGMSAHHGMMHGREVGKIDWDVIEWYYTEELPAPEVPALAASKATGNPQPPPRQQPKPSVAKPKTAPIMMGVTKEQESQLDFPIMQTDITKKNGSLKCKAVDCMKNRQAGAGCFCRVHYNKFLISTGQVESWECKCGNKVREDSLRCGMCHRWKNGEQSKQAYKLINGSAPAARPTSLTAGGLAVPGDLPPGTRTYVPPNSGVEICTSTRKNDTGQRLCKVMGCNKRDQTDNDGFCRMHFNQFAVLNASEASEAWTCICGEKVFGRQKRCGSCNRWKGGKREPYTQGFKDEKVVSAPALSLSQGPLWNCTNCNTSNESQRRKCRGCNKWKSEVASSNRPRTSYTVSSVAMAQRKKSPIESTLWKCRKCGFDNFPQIFDCGSCKTKRPNWQWYAKQQGVTAPSSSVTAAAQVPPVPPSKSKKAIDYRKTGVSDPRSNGKWRVDIAYKNRDRYIGTFSSLDDAALANEAARTILYRTDEIFSEQEILEKVSAAKEAAAQAIARAVDAPSPPKDAGDKNSVTSLAPESESSLPEASGSTEQSNAGESSALPSLPPQNETTADHSNKDYTIEDILNEEQQEYQPFGTCNESMSNLERSLHYDFNQSYYSNNTYTYLLGSSYSRSYSNMGATKLGGDTRPDGSRTAEDPKAEGGAAATKDDAEKAVKVMSEEAIAESGGKDSADSVHDDLGKVSKGEVNGEEAVATDDTTNAEKAGEGLRTDGAKTKDPQKAGGAEVITEGDAERASKETSDGTIADSAGEGKGSSGFANGNSRGVSKEREDKSAELAA